MQYSTKYQRLFEKNPEAELFDLFPYSCKEKQEDVLL
jgi:hypothetical protein